jgi:hypothetical protein
MSKRKNDISKLFIAILLMSIFFWVVMVTRYKYVQEDTRFDRLSGNINFLQDNGLWIAPSQKSEEVPTLLKFPEKERLNVSGRGRFSESRFRVTIENNSKWKIDEIDIEVDVYSSTDSTLLTTRYFTDKSLSEFNGTPFTKTKYSGKLPPLTDDQYNKWRIKSIRGHLYSGKHGE